MCIKIGKTVNSELTLEEIASIKKFRSYTEGGSFACLRERVMVMLDEPSKNAKELKEKALECMRQALSEHPDFSVYNMDDGRVLLFLNSGVFTYSAEPCQANMAVNLVLRAECLETVEKTEIIAIAYEED